MTYLRRGTLAGLVCALACAAPMAPATLTERYVLSDVGGARPPVAIGSFVYWGGSIELRADSTFVDVIVLGNSAHPTVVDSVRGTYRVDGDSVRCKPDGWVPYALWRDPERRRVRVRWETEYTYRREE